MSTLLTRIFVVMIAVLQFAGACGIASAQSFCLHPDGTARLESATERAACHQEQSLDPHELDSHEVNSQCDDADDATHDTGTSDSTPDTVNEPATKDCIDSPLRPDAPLEKSKLRTADAFQPALLTLQPAILTNAICIRPQPMRFDRAVQPVPKSEHLSLSSIVLVL